MVPTTSTSSELRNTGRASVIGNLKGQQREEICHLSYRPYGLRPSGFETLIYFRF